eukprot:1653103-Amphidinium_carterae.3
MTSVYCAASVLAARGFVATAPLTPGDLPGVLFTRLTLHLRCRLPSSAMIAGVCSDGTPNASSSQHLQVRLSQLVCCVGDVLLLVP